MLKPEASLHLALRLNVHETFYHPGAGFGGNVLIFCASLVLL